MKKIVYITCFILTHFCYSQSVESENNETGFTIIEHVPLHPKCNKNLSNADKKQCMAQEITKHVSKKFNLKIAKRLNLKGLQKIFVTFKINNQGKVTDIQAKGPHSKLEKEAIRVMKLLPKFKPGMQKGKPVTVPYALPIKFEVK